MQTTTTSPRRLFFLALLSALLAGCHTGGGDPAADEAAAADAETETAAPRALVTVGTVRADTLRDLLRLGAVSAYPARDILRATTTGYLLAPAPVPGQPVRAGQIVFRMQTKESRVLHLDQITGDPRLHFSGLIAIKAAQSGVLASVDKLAGDYVQDGEQLGVVYDRARFGFILDVPAPQLRYVHTGQLCRVLLPDGRSLPAQVAEVLPTADATLQTQRYTVRPLGPVPELPENLNVLVELDRTPPHVGLVLPRGAVLADETQTEFWVMRLLNDSTAVKVPIERGPEKGDMVEIKAPRFTSQDRILLTGNFGLADTAAVQLHPPRQ